MTKKSYPLRINEQVIAALQRWADDDLRSLNGQIEFVLRRALNEHGRAADANEKKRRIPRDQPDER